MGMKHIDMVGFQNGRLTVIEYSRSNGESAFWNCSCLCGKTVEVSGSSLRRKRNSTKSCGCIQREFASTMHTTVDNTKWTAEERAFRAIAHKYSNMAQSRNIKFHLTREDMASLWGANCYYCDSEPLNRLRIVKTKVDVLYQGIDRVDSCKPYIIDNCVPCCKSCNVSKLDKTQENFYSHIEKIYFNLKKKRLL